MRHGFLMCLLMLGLVGCGKSNVGVLSHTDYAYAAETAERITKAQARFESTVQLFEAAGFRAASVRRSEKNSEAILSSAGTEARIGLQFPDNGLATITLAYNFAGRGSDAKARAESVLARARGILAPD